MSIKKETAPELVRAGYHYAVYPVQISQQIKNTDALAVWHYLLTKAGDWTIRMKDIENHFTIGRDKARAAIRYLENMGLVWRSQKKDSKGQITDNEINCSAIPQNGEENRPTEKPTAGKHVPLNNDQINKKNNTRDLSFDEKPKPETREPVADGLTFHQLSDQNPPEWAGEGLQFHQITAQPAEVWRGFVLYHRANSPQKPYSRDQFIHLWDLWVSKRKALESAQSAQKPQSNQKPITQFAKIMSKAHELGRFTDNRRHQPRRVNDFEILPDLAMPSMSVIDMVKQQFAKRGGVNPLQSRIDNLLNAKQQI